MRTGGTVAISGALLTLPLLAQSGSATLTGKLQIFNGDGLPDAQVELRSDEPRRTFDTVTDNFGEYRFSSLPAAEYTLKFSLQGFMYLVVKSIRLSENDQHRCRR
jgi:hypothetical protein